MVRRLLASPTLVAPADATDALALAICQLWRGAATGRLERAVNGVRR
jgi:crossover junction endodeoxyribonuclease RuvC